MATDLTSWGLDNLDRVIGPLTPGRFYVVGARPGNGKTTFALSFLNSVYATIRSQPRRVLCFWTERSPYVAYRVWAALRLGLSADDVLMEAWDCLPTGAEAAINTEVTQLQWEDGILFSEDFHPTLSRIAEAVRQHRPNLVIFDYLQRVRPERRQEKFEAISAAANLFQRIALSGIVVLALSQLKRKGDGTFDRYRPPADEDMKGSGEIEESADVALGLFRPLLPMTAAEERKIRTGELDIARFTKPGEMAVKVLKHRWRGAALDKILGLRCDGGAVTTFPRAAQLEPPRNAGDAWEDEDDDSLPF